MAQKHLDVRINVDGLKQSAVVFGEASRMLGIMGLELRIKEEYERYKSNGGTLPFVCIVGSSTSIAMAYNMPVVYDASIGAGNVLIMSESDYNERERSAY